MFSGLISTLGTIIEFKKDRLIVATHLKSVKLGDSIAINGVCLTVAHLNRRKNAEVTFLLSSETKNLTTLTSLKPHSKVNIEPALKMSDSLGGHIVQGHVDGRALVTKIRKSKKELVMRLEAPKKILSGLVSKGSVTVDGVSLTVVAPTSRQFSVALIPYTWTHTNLHERQVGDYVNIETDVIGKYVQKYLKKS